MGLLEELEGPQDLRDLSADQLTQLAAEIRQRVPNGHPTGLTDDVADDQAPHRRGAIGHRA